MNLLSLRKEFGQLANKNKALVLQRFFKTGKGQYAEGDIFIGLTVPQSRIIAAKYKNLILATVKTLLKSKFHEERLIALLILINKFDKALEKEKEEIFNFYISNTKYINNWDLVDLSADKIVGEYLINKPKDILFKLAKSKNLWERRIAIVATYNFIKNKKYEDSLKIAEILLLDGHDLIQKAVGWMLREIGKQNKDVLIKFLAKYYKKMGRTTLRYSIERFPQDLRLKYLHGEV